MAQWKIKQMNHENEWELYFSQNALIIQVVVSIILFLSIYVIYKSYFSGSAESLNGSSLEKTLATLLEKQQELQKNVQGTQAAAGGANPELESKLKEAEEKLGTLKKSIEEKQKQIQELQSGSGASANSGSEPPSQDMLKKISELETKLFEYEIISEDLADLSKYKNENTTLKKELDELKKTATAAATATAVPTASPVADSPVPTEVAPVEPQPQPQEDVPPPSSPDEPFSVPATEATVSVGSESGEIKDIIDDDLMKEFELAVAKQKKGIDTPSAADAESTNPEVKAAEAGELINQFENFVKKE